MSQPSIFAVKNGTTYHVIVDDVKVTERVSKAKDFTHAVIRTTGDGTWTASLAASEEKAAKTAATTPDRYTEIHTVAFHEVPETDGPLPTNEESIQALIDDINSTVDEHMPAEDTAPVEEDQDAPTEEAPEFLADGEGPQVAPDEDEGYYRIIDTAAPHGPVEIMQFRHIDMSGEEENPDEQEDTEDTDDDGPTGWVTVEGGYVDADDEGPAALVDDESPEEAPETPEEDEKAPAPAPAPAKPEKAPETPEEAAAKKAARAERRRERLAKAEPEVLAERKAKINETRKAKRAAETPEERKARLDKRAEYRARRKEAREAAKQTVNA